jgi:DNA-binding transcriptional LysR family regulator
MASPAIEHDVERLGGAPPTTLERLRVFHAVATIGTIAGAARALDYTPSAVSQHVAALEREASVPLVERSNRGVIVTPAGRTLAARAADALDLVRNAFDELTAATEHHELTITVAAFPTAITAMLLPLRARLAPSIRMVIIAAEPEEALAHLIARDVDAAITDGHIDEHSSTAEQLHRSVLRTEPIQLVTRSNRIATSLAAYADDEWVLGAPSSRLGSAARQACRAAGFTPNVIAETDDHQVTFDVIRASGAVSLLPQLALTRLPRGLAVAAEVDVAIERRVEFVTRRPLRSNPAIARLAELLA